MLTLADSFRLGPCTIFRDVVYLDGQRSYSQKLFYLPDAPRLARDASGAPAFDFLWYRRPPAVSGADADAGGLVTLTAELGIPSERRDELITEAAATLGTSPAAGMELLSMPFKRGTVGLSFAGESGEGELTEAIGGAGAASLIGSQRATFVVELTQEGAALLWQAIEQREDLFHLSYDLVCDFRLDDVELRVWCDTEKAHGLAAELVSEAPLSAGDLRQRLVAQQVTGVELRSERLIDEEYRQSLEELGSSILEAALARSLFLLDDEVSGDRLLGDAAGAPVRPYHRSVAGSLNFGFSGSFPVERHITLTDVLRLEQGPQELGGRLRQITLDGGFFRVLEVKLLCTADFANSPIDRVKVTLEYDQRTPSGERIQRRGEFVFGAGEEVHRFRMDLASPDLRSYTYEVDVYYDGETEPLKLGPSSSDEEVLVLDVDQLGVLQVAIELRDVPFEVVRTAVVDLEYPSRNLSHRLLLNGATSSGAWRVITREAPGPYRHRVAWLTADERRIEEPWKESVAKTLWLDAPADLRRRARVLVLAGGDFGDIAQIVVSLAATDGSSSVELALTSADERHLWEPQVADPASFRYRVGMSIIYRDGRRHAFDPYEDDRPVLLARDLLRFQVRVVARRLDLGGRWRMGLVAFEYEDQPAGLREKETLVLRAPDDEALWSFRLGSPDRRRYRYQLTLIPQQGERLTSAWQEADQEILVLGPPAVPN